MSHESVEPYTEKSAEQICREWVQETPKEVVDATIRDLKAVEERARRPQRPLIELAR